MDTLSPSGPFAGERFAEQTYAGVIGKLIGVYLGRAVEGWSYEAIRKTFGEIDYFVNDKVNWPLVVPDDDISGTFLFYRALEDNGFPKDIGAKAIGDTWLNYIIEDKTVLWWGGLGRSTEHTAYLRLKAGIHAPESGSARLNSRAMAEAIGSEIFIDTWALSNPGDPERAAAMARAAGSVSHDGIAVEAAILLAAMEAHAFVEADIDSLLETGLRFVRSEELKGIVGQVREQCARANHWRQVRQWLEENHSYRHYPGCCPMVPNHALLLSSLILGGNDVQRGLMIAVSSGWDTDCNAGNLACLNGIRLGLRAFENGPDFRGPIADLMYVVGADGGECLTDAVIETRRARRAAAALQGTDYTPPSTRFAFEYPGSVQGFQPCPRHQGRQAVVGLGNINRSSPDNGLEIRFEALATGVSGAVSVPTFIDPKPRALSDTSYFEVLASPSIYETQTVRATVRAWPDALPTLRFFIIYYDENSDLSPLYGDPVILQPGDNALSWRIPSTGGRPIHRIGIALSSDVRCTGRIALLDMDWKGAPEAFVMGGALDLTPGITPFDTTAYWLKAFVSSAIHFRPDVDTTFALSHPSSNGLATIGTRDWADYRVSSKLTMDLHKAAGLVIRARGHRRYYGGILSHGVARLVRRMDDDIVVLAECPFSYEEHQTIELELAAHGDRLSFSADGKCLMTARDSTFADGGAGLFIEEGTIPTLGFAVRAIA